ncbi:hypothetical protein COF81_14665 [Bacillus pseudomycoides]|uniref:Transposase n=1 Tax=Bacillus pseudomycoides TaxID=64104 RepID=A0ABD6T9Q4_9BACI|nr:hypothetical protein [Bacillus pseudomycoides]PHE95356.1 hypothetical protein COF81_14665 [Bacillus pseudomycoides]
MLDKDMITLDNPKKKYFERYAKENKDQINANARMRRMKQKEKLEKYDELLATHNKLVSNLRQRGMNVEELLQ